MFLKFNFKSSTLQRHFKSKSNLYRETAFRKKEIMLIYLKLGNAYQQCLPSSKILQYFRNLDCKLRLGHFPLNAHATRIFNFFLSLLQHRQNCTRCN